MDLHTLQLSSILPFDFSAAPSPEILLPACIGIILIGFPLRAIFGKHSIFVQALSATIATVCLYGVAILLFRIAPSQFSLLIAPLPFLEISGNALRILPFHAGGFRLVCENIITLCLLSFFANLFVGTLPQGKSFTRKLLRIVLCLMLTYAAYYLLMQLQNTHLAGLFTSYGPIILLGILVVLFLSGAIGLLLGLVLATVNPLLGGICTFFFSRTIGRHLTKTIITTVLFLLFLTVLMRLGYAYI